MILGIFCAGNLGREVYDIASRINTISHRWNKIVFLDNYVTVKKYYDTSVYRLEQLEGKKEHIEIVIANGEPSIRKAIYDQLKEEGFRLGTLVDPTAIVSPTASLGEGVIVTPFSTISSNVQIGDNVLIQSYIRVGHDIIVGRHSVLSSNSCIGGKTAIGEASFVGMGAVIQEERILGEHVVLGMGAVLFSDLPDHVIAVGNPARIVKKNDTDKVFK